MRKTCPKCNLDYDDAERFTFCPHPEFLSLEERVQKDLGMKLLGQPVRFAHQRDTGPDYRVCAVGRTGMVALEGMAGQFAPHLFVQVMGE